MEIDFAMLADAAASPPDGKLYIHGGAFDTITSTVFPCVHQSLSVVIRLLANRTEADDTHTVGIRLRDSSGQDVIPFMQAMVQPQRALMVSRGVTYTVVATMNTISFPHPGEYSFDIVVDSRSLKSLPLYLVTHSTPGYN